MKRARIPVIFIILFLVVLRFFHLDADFPHNYTQYGVLYTDEGAYLNAATAHVLTGHWYVEGDFNTAVNLPIFPLFQLLSFKAFGLSLTSARLTVLFFFILLLIALYSLVKAYSNVTVALLSLLLISVNFNVFAFSRLAIMEIPMTFFVILSFLLASNRSIKRQGIFIILSGLVFVVAVLTKTSAIFALPILIYIIFKKQKPIPDKVTYCALLCSVVAAGFIVYYFILVKPYLLDYQFYHTTNLYTRTHTGPLLLARGIAKAAFYGKHMGIIIYAAGMVYSVFFFFTVKEFRRHSLIWISLLWISVYMVMIGSQSYSPPRYYTPLVIPLSISVALMIHHFLKTRIKSVQAILFIAAILISVAGNTAMVFRYILSPEYSWMAMADDIKNQIESDECANPVLLGHFSNSISLTTGIFSINDHKGTSDLRDRIEKYAPNYYVCLGPVKDDVRPVIEEYYDIERVSQYDVFNNYYTGEPVALYRLSEK